MKNLSLRISDELAARISEAAKRRGITVSDYMRDASTDYLNTEQMQLDLSSMEQRIIERVVVGNKTLFNTLLKLGEAIDAKLDRIDELEGRQS